MRIKGLDFARALAILGMMLVNYKVIFCSETVIYGSANAFISLFEGRAAAVFLVLSGIGLSLMSRRKVEEKNAVRKVIAKRALFLFAIGLGMYIVFDWSADILHFYGIYMLMILPILFLDIRKLVMILLAVLLITLVLQISFDYLEGWDETVSVYSDFYSFEGFVRNTFFNGYHPVFPWISFMIIGVLIGRLKFDHVGTIKKYISISLTVAVTTEVLSWTITNLLDNEIIYYLFDTKPMNPSIGYIIAASSWAIAFILLCVYVIDHKQVALGVGFLIPTGQMALTHYLGHSIIVLTLFDVFGMLKGYDELFVLALSGIVFLLMIIYSNLRKKRHNRGHMEALMRMVSA